MSFAFKSKERFTPGLVGVVDRKDPYHQSAHVIKPIRESTHRIPDWLNDDGEVRRFLLRCFPHMNERRVRKRWSYRESIYRRRLRRQREKAGLWMRVIQLYFRMGKTQKQVADELGHGITPNQVRGVARSIIRAKARMPKPRGGERPGAGRPRIHKMSKSRRIR